MFRNLFVSLIAGAVLASGGLLHGEEMQSRELNVFDHRAFIPATARLSTIRFVSARSVVVPSVLSQTADYRYCEQLAFREPGGSAYCPSTSVKSSVVAYQVTYSFEAAPAPWDETGEIRATFDVYFRPDELTPSMLKALSDRKSKAKQIAEYFSVNTQRQPMTRVVVDQQQSTFCDGEFVEGAWTRTDSHCADRIGYKRVTVPADQITVQVDPRGEIVSATR